MIAEYARPVTLQAKDMQPEAQMRKQAVRNLEKASQKKAEAGGDAMDVDSA